jgi:hypothetical protein
VSPREGASGRAADRFRVIHPGPGGPSGRPGPQRGKAEPAFVCSSGRYDDQNCRQSTAPSRPARHSGHPAGPLRGGCGMKPHPGTVTRRRHTLLWNACRGYRIFRVSHILRALRPARRISGRPGITLPAGSTPAAAGRHRGPLPAGRGGARIRKREPSMASWPGRWQSGSGLPPGTGPARAGHPGAGSTGRGARTRLFMIKGSCTA